MSVANDDNRSKISLKTDFKVKEIRFPVKYLRSLLLNLLSNAYKYRFPGRELEVRIKTVKQDGFVMLSIQDNGLGIAEDRIGELFSKFKRIHNLTSNIEGTGIGLYLVKKMVTNAGGEIKVESKFGEGTCFKVYFRE